MNEKKIIKIVFSIFILAVLIFIFFIFQQNIKSFLNYLLSNNLVADLKKFKYFSFIPIFILITISNAFPGVPSAPFDIISGIVLGPVFGSIINILALSLSNLILLLFFLWLPNLKSIKNLEKNKTYVKFDKQLNKVKSFKLYLTMLYAIPFIPRIILNFLNSNLKITFFKKVLIILVGNIPSGIFYATGGNSIYNGQYKILIIIIFISLLFFYSIKKIVEKKIDLK